MSESNLPFTARTLVMAVECANRIGPAPRYCALTVTPKLINKAKDLAATARKHDVGSLVIELYPEAWGSKDTEDSLGLSNSEMVIHSTGDFWLTDITSNREVIATPLYNLEKLESLISSTTDQCVAFENDAHLISEYLADVESERCQEPESELSSAAA